MLIALAFVAPVACSSAGEGDGGSVPTSATGTVPSPTSDMSASSDPTISPVTSIDPLPPHPALVADLQALLDDSSSTLALPDATVQAGVLAPAAGLEWAATAGPDSVIDRPFRMASVGKTFTAATVLRLVETGVVGLDASIADLLLPDTATLLAADGYDLSLITVAQLLQHTAGVYDYAFGDGSPFLQQALADRRKVWTRREQLELAVSVGDPLWVPGTGFRYSDTGYVLLGEIIEVATGQPYPTVMRDLLGFERLGMSNIWLESGEPAPASLPAIARSFFAGDEVTDLDFSLDAFGGGGLAGTTSDVARFFGALLGGGVFAQSTTLETMLMVPGTNLAQEEFGIVLGDGASGLYRLDVGGQTCWSHRGFLGTIAMACPDVGVSVVVTTNTALTDPLPIATLLLTRVLDG